MDHLVRVEVTGIFPIVSVTGYRTEDEYHFDADGRPEYDAEGNPVFTSVTFPTTEDVSKPGFAMLDPAETNIRALVKAGLVRIAPLPKPTAKEAGK